VEGDKLELYFDRKLKSIGNAAIHKGEQNIYGDLIEYDVQNENVHVLGNARLELKDSQVLGPELNMKLGETVGEMKNPTFTLKKQFSNVLQLGRSRTNAAGASTTTVTDARTGTTSQQVEDENADDGLGVGKRSGDSRGDASIVFFECQIHHLLGGPRRLVPESGRT
jgi:LPS-assembly protein